MRNQNMNQEQNNRQTTGSREVELSHVGKGSRDGERKKWSERIFKKIKMCNVHEPTPHKRYNHVSQIGTNEK